MKKLTILFLILALALTACGGGGDDDDSDEDAIEATATEEVQAVEATDEAEMEETAEATDEVEMEETAEADDDEAEMEMTAESDDDETEMEMTAEADDGGSTEVELIDGFTLLDQDCPLQFDIQYPAEWEVVTMAVNNYVWNVTAGDDSVQVSINVRGSGIESGVENILSRASGESIGQITGSSADVLFDVIGQDRDDGRRYTFVTYNGGQNYYTIRLDVDDGAVSDEVILQVAQSMIGNGCL